MLARRRSPEARIALREAEVAMERYAGLVAERMLERVEAIREGFDRRTFLTRYVEPNPEIEEAWDEFESHLTALRVVHGERAAARKLRDRCLPRSLNEFQRLARQKGMEVIERTDNL